MKKDFRSTVRSSYATTGTWVLAVSCIAAVLGAAARGDQSSAQAARNGGRHFDRIVTIWLENINYSDAIKNPYLKDLASRGTLFSDFHALFHPSYANYLATVGGNYFGTFMDCQKTIDSPNVADLLEAKGYTWKNYAEGYPGSCFLGDTYGRYARKHVPFASFKDIQTNPERCAKIVNADQFQQDWLNGTLPNYSFYSPDLDDDAHDTGLEVGAQWLQGFLKPLLADPVRMQGTLFFITFDESGFSPFDDNHIYAVAIGPAAKSGFVTKKYHNHYDHLVMVEDNFGLGNLDGGDDPDFDNPIDEIWATSSELRQPNSVP